MGRLFVVAHAVERYHKRWRPQLTLRQAQHELYRIAERAVATKRKTRAGQEIWVANTDNHVQFVVKRDAQGPVCVTVLPQGADEYPDTGDAILDAFREHQEELNYTISRRKEILREQGRLCEECETDEVNRYSLQFRKRWCERCYLKKRRTVENLGRVPFFNDWLSRQPAKTSGGSV